VLLWVLFAALSYVAIDALRIRKGQLRNILWYPPLWSAVPLGWGFAVLSEQLPHGIRPRLVAPDWNYLHAVTFALSALGIAILLRWVLERRPPGQTEPAVVSNEAAVSWESVSAWISSGERPITRREQDLFHHQPIAKKIAQAVGTEGRPLALLGKFGAGKTSIINLARTELERSAPTVIVATVDVWAVPNPDDIPRLALRRMVAALEDHIDTLDLRTLPLTYQRIVAAEPTGARLFRLLGFDGATDSLEAIGRLSPLLEVLDARLVLIVQDVERTGKRFDARHLDRFLWALREVKRASFILAVDPRNVQSDFSKLCDTIEAIPNLDVRQVAEILGVAYGYWTTEFHDIDPHRDRPKGGALGLDKGSQEGLVAYLSTVGGDGRLAAMAALLGTPRSLKHVLRRVDHIWNQLHGEVELDDVIVLSVLRHSAAPAYDFLVRNIDALHHTPSDMMPRTKTVKGDWDTCRKTLPTPTAVTNLVEALGIKQLSQDHPPSGLLSPQGIHASEPTDYFRRILSEEIGGADLRDQTVLSDVERWQSERDGTLVTRLLAAVEGSARYALVWEHFSFRQPEAELMALTETVVARVLERDGAAADGEHPAIVSLWRACNTRLPKGQVTNWIQDLILSAVPTSLNLVNDLYYYWTGDYGVVVDAERPTIREAVVQAVRRTVRTGRALTSILSSGHPYSVMRLITQTGVETGVSAYAAWQDYLPQVLIDGAKQDPEAVVPELANLAGDEQSGHRAVGPQYPPVFLRRYKIDRGRTLALFRERLDGALVLLADYDGENPYAVRARKDAALWLKERGASAGGK